jgi:Metallo-beta-lactamase superfamily
MREVLPGVVHWTAIHPHIHSEVSSYWVEEDGVLVDPLVPPEEGGIEWFKRRDSPVVAIVLSNRHHFRDSGRFVEEFGCPVYVPEAGMHEFGDDEPVIAYGPGEELPGGLVVHEIGALCPDEMALHRPASRAVFIADGVVTGAARGQSSQLGFVPDSLMDDPPETKRGLLAAYQRLLAEVDFDHLLLAHGGPVLDGGRDQLEELVAIGGRTAFVFEL